MNTERPYGIAESGAAVNPAVTAVDEGFAKNAGPGGENRGGTAGFHGGTKRTTPASRFETGFESTSTRGLPQIGRYQIVRHLGSGACGNVFSAYDPVLDRQIALKVLHSYLPVEERDTYLRRFAIEVRMLGRLSHPHIVAVYDAGLEAERPFLAMELCSGPGLQEIVARSPIMPPGQVLWVSRQLTSALEYVHARGIVHRDIKPANLLFHRGTLKLTDFGIARDDGNTVTIAGELLGTPGFIAPEQVMGETLDHRADLYAVGVMLFELLAGRRPFVGDTLSLLYRLANADPPLFSTVTDSYNTEFDEFFAKALHRDRIQRFQSAPLLQTALDRIIASHLLEPLPGLEWTDDLTGPIPAPDSTSPDVRTLSGTLFSESTPHSAGAVDFEFLGDPKRSSPEIELDPEPSVTIPELPRKVLEPALAYPAQVAPAVKPRQSRHLVVAAAALAGVGLGAAIWSAALRTKTEPTPADSTVTRASIQPRQQPPKVQQDASLGDLQPTNKTAPAADTVLGSAVMVASVAVPPSAAPASAAPASAAPASAAPASAAPASAAPASAAPASAAPASAAPAPLASAGSVAAAPASSLSSASRLDSAAKREKAAERGGADTSGSERTAGSASAPAMIASSPTPTIRFPVPDGAEMGKNLHLEATVQPVSDQIRISWRWRSKNGSWNVIPVQPQSGKVSLDLVPEADLLFVEVRVETSDGALVASEDRTIPVKSEKVIPKEANFEAKPLEVAPTKKKVQAPPSSF